MARKNSRRRRGGFTLPLAIVAGLAPAAGRAVYGFKMDGLQGVGYQLTDAFTGYDAYQNKWLVGDMKRGLLPLVLGLLVHKVVGGKLGVNRALGACNVPFIRI